MELSLKYAYIVWQKKSFSSAAKSLFVSQPALSATVARLEKELGFKIFDRSTNPISLTAQGSVYMDYLSEIIEKENLLNQRLRALDNSSCGSIIVRGRMHAANYILTIVCGDFYKKYPNINVTIDMNRSNARPHSENVDVVFTYIPGGIGQESVPILEERLIVAIHKEHPAASHLAKFAVPYEQIVDKNVPLGREVDDTSIFEDVPFIESGESSDSDKRRHQMLSSNKVSPYVVTNCPNYEFRYKLMHQKLGAVLVSDLFLSSLEQAERDVYFIPLKSPLSFRTLYISYSQSRKANEVLQKFISSVFECCKSNPKLIEYSCK